MQFSNFMDFCFATNFKNYPVYRKSLDSPVDFKKNEAVQDYQVSALCKFFVIYFVILSYI